MKQKRLFVKAGLAALLLICATLTSWEVYLRSQGRGIAYDDGGSLWSDKRKQVYEPKDKATVFIGSSRIKYDLDIPTWQKLTGDHAIQLANVGSSPLLMLYDLADDKNFKGKLVIDVTEFLFFAEAPYAHKTPHEVLDYYKKETLAQQASFAVNRLLESEFMFLDKEEYSLNALLASSRVPNRPGVYEMPDFPAGFTPVSFDRQSYMTDELVNDSNGLKQVTAVWAMLGEMAQKMPPITPAAKDSIIASVKSACDKIKARGGTVLFVRTPSSGPLRGFEKMGFPREAFWDRILQVTGCEGIHFEDYASLSGFECPEFSHLNRSQAVTYTRGLIDVLRSRGWKFPSDRSISSTSKSTSHGL